MQVLTLVLNFLFSTVFFLFYSKLAAFLELLLGFLLYLFLLTVTNSNVYRYIYIYINKYT